MAISSNTSLKNNQRKVRKLLIILNDRLSTIIEKGELIPRYYNPGNVFDEVHFFLLNNDRPAKDALQSSVGSAEIFFYNFPAGLLLFIFSAAWAPLFLRIWSQFAICKARVIQPNLIRCYGNWLNGYLGAQIKKAMGVPVVISLHGNPDVDYYRGRRAKNLFHFIYGWACKRVELISLSYADFCMPVYSPIIAYLLKYNFSKYAVIYNVVGLGSRQKTNYHLSGNKINLICVGRQDELEKDPTAIIKSLVNLPNVFLTLVGNGSLHDALKKLVKQLDLEERVLFHTAVPNNEILKLMYESDIYVYSSNNYEISKSTMEAALIGLPIVVNDRNGSPASELVGGHFSLVDGSSEGYALEIEKLIKSEEYRKQLGKKARDYAVNMWDPVRSEERAAEVHKRYLSNFC